MAKRLFAAISNEKKNSEYAIQDLGCEKKLWGMGSMQK
jgi:hypothetical protein